MTNCITRNYHAHGGSEWVIGGKLTFLPGATVEGAEGLFDLPSAPTPASPMIPYIADSEATTVAALKDNFNALLAAMRPAVRRAASRALKLSFSAATVVASLSAM